MAALVSKKAPPKPTGLSDMKAEEGMSRPAHFETNSPCAVVPVPDTVEPFDRMKAGRGGEGFATPLYIYPEEAIRGGAAFPPVVSSCAVFTGVSRTPPGAAAA